MYFMNIYALSAVTRPSMVKQIEYMISLPLCEVTKSASSNGQSESSARESLGT